MKPKKKTEKSKIRIDIGQWIKLNEDKKEGFNKDLN